MEDLIMIKEPETNEGIEAMIEKSNQILQTDALFKFSKKRTQGLI
jgi:hypothetical protein